MVPWRCAHQLALHTHGVCANWPPTPTKLLRGGMGGGGARFRLQNILFLSFSLSFCLDLGRASALQATPNCGRYATPLLRLREPSRTAGPSTALRCTRKRSAAVRAHGLGSWPRRVAAHMRARRSRSPRARGRGPALARAAVRVRGKRGADARAAVCASSATNARTRACGASGMFVFVCVAACVCVRMRVRICVCLCECVCGCLRGRGCGCRSGCGY